jgi:hypothetical protein
MKRLMGGMMGVSALLFLVTFYQATCPLSSTEQLHKILNGVTEVRLCKAGLPDTWSPVRPGSQELLIPYAIFRGANAENFISHLELTNSSKEFDDKLPFSTGPGQSLYLEFYKDKELIQQMSIMNGELLWSGVGRNTETLLTPECRRYLQGVLKPYPVFNWKYVLTPGASLF